MCKPDNSVSRETGISSVSVQLNKNRMEYFQDLVEKEGILGASFKGNSTSEEIVANIKYDTSVFSVEKIKKLLHIEDS